jgi:hypothetical protein
MTTATTLSKATETRLSEMRTRSLNPDFNLLAATKQVLRSVPFNPALDETSMRVAGLDPVAVRDTLTDALTRDLLERAGTPDEFRALIDAAMAALRYPDSSSVPTA